MSEILTGYEMYEESHAIDIDASIQAIQDAMFSRNPEKYGDFLKTLKLVRLTFITMRLPHVDTRVELFKCVYYAMRLLDDVIDGDTIPPLTLEKRQALLDSILTWSIENIANPLYKTLSIKISELSQRLWKEEEMQTATLEIIQSMKFDLERIVSEDKIRARQDLEKNFHMMDIRGTIVGTAIIFWIRLNSIVKQITPLWKSCRIMYNLRDFWEDILAELINIPKEDLEIFGITKTDIEQIKREVRETNKKISYENLPESIKKWFLSEMKTLQKLMKQHEINMRENCEFEDTNNPILIWLRNLILKKIVFPKAYSNEISKRIPKIAKIIN